MKERIDEIFSQYRVTGRILGFKYPSDGLGHGICLIVINLIVQVMNSYNHTSIVDGKVIVDGSDTMLSILDVSTFVIGFWMLNVAHKRFLIKKILRLTEISLKKQNVELNDDSRLELIRRGCEHFQVLDHTLKVFITDFLKILSLALFLSLVKVIILVAII